MCRDERVHALFVTSVKVMVLQGLNGKIKTAGAVNNEGNFFVDKCRSICHK